MSIRVLRLLEFNVATGQFSARSVFNTKAVIKPTGSILQFGVNIHDVIMFVLSCKMHHKVILKQMPPNNKTYYLPVYPLILACSWTNQITHYLITLLKTLGFSPEKCSVRDNLLQWNQIVLPKYLDYLHQIVLTVEVESGCTGQCSANTLAPTFKWFAHDQLSLNRKDTFGPEPYLYLSQSDQHITRCQEMSIWKECKQSSKKWSIVRSVEYTEKEVATLYGHYLQQCYPSQLMDQTMWNDFVVKCGLTLPVNSKVHAGDKNRLFATMCGATSPHYTTFKDVLFTLVALDGKANHGGNTGEIRAQCIFRYYAASGAPVLTYAEMVNMFEDIIVATKRKVAGNSRLATEAVFKQQSLDRTAGLTMDRFLELVGSLAIRGTAGLFRSKISPLTEIRAPKCISESTLWVRIVPLGQEKKVLSRKMTKCDQCETQDYYMAIHSISFSEKDYSISYSQELPSSYTIKFPRPVRERSMELVNPMCVYNDIRNILRRFAYSKFGFPHKDSIPSGGHLKWDKKEDRNALVDKIIKVCIDAKEYFQKQPRVLKCTSPLYVFGDIHGNFYDLMIYDQLFWRGFPDGVVCGSLFLGDYVDRGDNSVECILYLLCNVMLLPDKFHLLRGNHEMRPIQQQFTFQRECLDKFGSTGRFVWEAFNQVFDCMSLCAVVDEQIYCAHGGIPTSCTRLEALHDIPVPLVTPNSHLKGKVGWEVLWNDPISRTEYNDMANALIQSQQSFPMYPIGFLPNIKRGTAYYYSELAVDNFLEQNGLTGVIRGHEVIPPGFAYAMEGRVLTIFSCSNYCSAANESAVVYIERAKLRVIKIETNQKIEFK